MSQESPPGPSGLSSKLESIERVFGGGSQPGEIARELEAAEGQDPWAGETLAMMRKGSPLSQRVTCR